MASVRFNHMELTFPRGTLEPAFRKEVADFYGDVFGWEEHATETVERQKLVLRVHSHEQFVFLIADDSPMRCPPLDHFGMSVGTIEELDETLARARARAGADARVRLIDKQTEDFGPLKLSSFYVGFRLPLMIEVQHFDWDL